MSRNRERHPYPVLRAALAKAVSLLHDLSFEAQQLFIIQGLTGQVDAMQRAMAHETGGIR